MAVAPPRPEHLGATVAVVKRRLRWWLLYLQGWRRLPESPAMPGRRLIVNERARRRRLERDLSSPSFVLFPTSGWEDAAERRYRLAMHAEALAPRLEDGGPWV